MRFVDRLFENRLEAVSYLVGVSFGDEVPFIDFVQFLALHDYFFELSGLVADKVDESVGC